MSELIHAREEMRVKHKAEMVSLCEGLVDSLMQFHYKKVGYIKLKPSELWTEVSLLRSRIQSEGLQGDDDG